jgi:acetyl-CoA carboxylase carboxyltransferase component
VRQKFPETHEQKLAYLRELREEATHSASEEAVVPKLTVITRKAYGGT